MKTLHLTPLLLAGLVLFSAAGCGNREAAAVQQGEQVASAGAEAAPGDVKPAANMANAKQCDTRYQGGVEKMQTGYDLSKVKLPATPTEQAQAADDDAHAGHDHAAEAAAPVEQPGAALLNQVNKGRITLLEGEQNFDFGKLRQGELGGHEFLLVSDGEEPLVVTGIKPSCGCTKADMVLVDAQGARVPYTKGDPIPVGQRFILESNINTDGRQGPFNATVSLYANDVRGATYNLRLTADVEPVLTVTPSTTVFFGRMTTAEKKEQTVTVTATRGEAFKLSMAQETAPEPVKIEYKPKNPDAEGRASEWEINVALGPNAEIGMRNYPLNFKSDIPVAHPKYPSQDGSPQFHGVAVIVQAQVTGMVSAEPQFVTFGMVRPGEPVERTLRIECHDEYRIKSDMGVAFEGLQGQEFPYADVFKVTVTPVDEGKAADVVLRLEGFPDDLNGSFGGVLKLKVGHPYMDELLVRFSGVCRSSSKTSVSA